MRLHPTYIYHKQVAMPSLTKTQRLQLQKRREIISTQVYKIFGFHKRYFVEKEDVQDSIPLLRRLQEDICTNFPASVVKGFSSDSTGPLNTRAALTLLRRMSRLMGRAVVSQKKQKRINGVSKTYYRYFLVSPIVKLAAG